MSYGVTKKCTRCHKKAFHYSKLDNICADCEAALYYPNDPMQLAIASGFKQASHAKDDKEWQKIMHNTADIIKGLFYDR